MPGARRSRGPKRRAADAASCLFHRNMMLKVTDVGHHRRAANHVNYVCGLCDVCPAGGTYVVRRPSSICRAVEIATGS
jgi:hypothetical protein